MLVDINNVSVREREPKKLSHHLDSFSYNYIVYNIIWPLSKLKYKLTMIFDPDLREGVRVKGQAKFELM